MKKRAKTARSSYPVGNPPENPKDAFGVAKVSLSYVPEAALIELALGMMEGRKYGRSNYRVAPVVASVYTDAALRHLLRFQSGVDRDPASNVHEIGKAMASLAVLMGAIAQGTWIDDRPPRLPADYMERANEIADHIVKTFPAVPPYTEKEHGKSSRKVPRKNKKVRRKAAPVRRRKPARSKRKMRRVLRAASQSPATGYDQLQ